jgi:hypothetical protein
MVQKTPLGCEGDTRECSSERKKKGKAKEVHYVSGLFFFLFSLAAISLSI